jgi:hypothetical protein
MSARASVLALLIAGAVFGDAPTSSHAAEPPLEIRVDLRVETCAVLCRLAGLEEYQTSSTDVYHRLTWVFD